MPLSPVSSTVDAGLDRDLLQQRPHADHRVALADDAIEAVGLRLASRAARALRGAGCVVSSAFSTSSAISSRLNGLFA